MIQKVTDATGKEMESEEIRSIFEKEYLEQDGPIGFGNYRTVPDAHASEIRRMTAEITWNGEPRIIEGKGNGPIDGFIDALKNGLNLTMAIQNYHEHAVGKGADATAVAYVEVSTPGRRHPVRRRPRPEHRGGFATRHRQRRQPGRQGRRGGRGGVRGGRTPPVVHRDPADIILPRFSG